MSALEQLFAAEQFSLPTEARRSLLLAEVNELTCWHEERCPAYANILRASGVRLPLERLEDLPYIPVRLFKNRRLQSIPDEAVFKVLASSGTTSQTPSRIVLDRATAQAQTHALAAIMNTVLQRRRMPMLICDAANVLKDRTAYSARGAGILGMSTFGRDHFYALDDRMELRSDELDQWLAARRGEAIFIFGFTFMVWQYVIQRLLEAQRRIEPHGGLLIHGGGWKTLQEQAIDAATYRHVACETLGVAGVFNYYGMVEQTGSIYMECTHGYLHPSNFSEVIVRDYRTWQPCPQGIEGVLQTISVLPRSYPGHSLLTEDLAVVHGVDDCPCGRKGARFTVSGRIPHAELRGCSDTHARSAVGVGW